MVKTSNIKIEINYNNIDKNYDIYKIGQEVLNLNKESRKNISKTVENLADNLSPALAILYRYGGFIYAIFSKDSFSEVELNKWINNELSNNNLLLSVKKVNIHHEIYPNELCQLFCNMIPYEVSIKGYNNIMGKLYYFDEDSFTKDTITAYNISIDCIEWGKQNYDLNINAVSFNKISKILRYKPKYKRIRTLPRYYIDKKEYIFKRATKDIKEDDCFIKMNPGSKKNMNIAYDIDINDIKKFNNSKKGILYRFLEDFKTYFNQFINIELIDLDEIAKYKSFINIKSSDDKIAIINKLGVNLINKVNDNLSNEMINAIESELYSIGIEKNKKLSNKMFNIILIHDSEYYEKNKEVDPHKNELFSQHITYETCITEKGKVQIDRNAILRIIDELLIKYDIYNERISLVNWKCDDKIEYITMESIYNDKKSCYENVFSNLTIYPNACMKYKKISESDYQLFNQYKKIFIDDHKKHFNYIVKPEMLITYKDIKLFIMDTSIVILPDLNQIHFRLSNFAKTKVLSKEKLIRILQEMIVDYPIYKERENQLIDTLKKSKKTSYQYQEITNGQTITNKNKVIPLFPLKSSFGKTFVKYAREKYNIILNPCLKSDVVNIYQYIRILTDKINPNILYYYVGKTNSIKQRVNTSIHLRKMVLIEGLWNDSFINYIFDQLRVDFVRNGEFTVLPFVNKYINEYKKIS